MRVLEHSIKQVAEYSWIQEFEGKQFRVKVRVFFTPSSFGVATGEAGGKYSTSVFIGGKCYPLDDMDCEPSESQAQGLCKRSDAYVERPWRHLAGGLNSGFACDLSRAKNPVGQFTGPARSASRSMALSNFSTITSPRTSKWSGILCAAPALASDHYELRRFP